MKYKNAIEKSWNYLSSWRNGSGWLEGIIATYWDSSESITLPHVMNHFPVIEALCEIDKCFDSFDGRSFIEPLADFYVTSIGDDGIYKNAWGDVPPKSTGVVHQAAASGALLSAYTLTGNSRYLAVAANNLKTCQDKWPGLLLNGVANQGMKYVEASLKLRELEPEDYRIVSRSFPEYLRIVEGLLSEAPNGGFFIDQSVYNNFWMSCYEAKCLHGLLAMVEAGFEVERCTKIINGLVEALVKNHYLGGGMFISHTDYQDTTVNKTIRYLFAALRRVPVCARSFELERLRRNLVGSLCDIDTHVAPIWIARAADTAYILNRCKPFLTLSIDTVLAELDNLILSSQLPHGGVPNAVGPWMDGMDSWQRQICSTRWNAYVFRYLSLFLEVAPEFKNKKQRIESVTWGDDFVNVTESDERVVVSIRNKNKNISWEKPS